MPSQSSSTVSRSREQQKTSVCIPAYAYENVQPSCQMNALNRTSGERPPFALRRTPWWPAQMIAKVGGHSSSPGSVSLHYGERVYGEPGDQRTLRTRRD